MRSLCIWIRTYAPSTFRIFETGISFSCVAVWCLPLRLKTLSVEPQIGTSNGIQSPLLALYEDLKCSYQGSRLTVTLERHHRRQWCWWILCRDGTCERPFDYCRAVRKTHVLAPEEFVTLPPCIEPNSIGIDTPP